MKSYNTTKNTDTKLIKLYLNKKLLKKLNRQCKKRGIALNAYLTLEMNKLVWEYKQKNLFFYTGSW